MFRSVLWGCSYMGLMRKFKLLGADILSVLLTVDGTGSKLDADMVDGKHYNDITAAIDKKIETAIGQVIGGNY